MRFENDPTNYPIVPCAVCGRTRPTHPQNYRCEACFREDWT